MHQFWSIINVLYQVSSLATEHEAPLEELLSIKNVRFLSDCVTLPSDSHIV